MAKLNNKKYVQKKKNKWLANDFLHRRLLNNSQKVPRKKKKVPFKAQTEPRLGPNVNIHSINVYKKYHM